jgi:hypothetical protein
MKDLRAKLDAMLARDALLAPHWTAPPQAFLGGGPPVPADHAVVWLCVGRRDLNVPALWEILSRVVLTSRRVLPHGKRNGIDLVPRLYEPGRMDPLRILRVNIEPGAIPDVLRLEGGALLRSKPVPGVHCGWYEPLEGLVGFANAL